MSATDQAAYVPVRNKFQNISILLLGLDNYQEHSVSCFPNVTTCSIGRIKAKYTNEVII